MIDLDQINLEAKDYKYNFRINVVKLTKTNYSNNVDWFQTDPGYFVLFGLGSGVWESSNCKRGLS